MFETPSQPEQKAELKVEIFPEFQEFIPVEFKADPFLYFETHGKNIKPGETVYEGEKIKEDPRAVKNFPVWTNETRNELRVVAKKVNPKKGKVGKTSNPFHEIDVMIRVRSLGLPAPAPIAKIQKGEESLILMERAKGLTIFDDDLEASLAEHGYTEEDKELLKRDAEQKMRELQERFEKAGVKRKWKLADMVFQVDFTQKKIIGITPVDWERTETLIQV